MYIKKLIYYTFALGLFEFEIKFFDLQRSKQSPFHPLNPRPSTVSPAKNLEGPLFWN